MQTRRQRASSPHRGADVPVKARRRETSTAGSGSASQDAPASPPPRQLPPVATDSISSSPAVSPQRIRRLGNNTGAGAAPSAADGFTLPSPAANAASTGGEAASAVSASEATDVASSRSKRWRDWTVRWASALVMIAFFLSYVYFTRQLGVAVFVLVVQTLIYGELVRLASKASVEAQMPGFRFFYVFWFCVFSFYMYGTVLKPHVLRALAAAGAAAGEAGMVATGLRCVEWVVRHHVLLSFSLYTLGFVAFVVSLRQRKNFKYQFQQFGFCHLALILAVGQSTYFVSNVFQGLFWLMLPVTLVVVNDSFAYIFGFLFGRTPLIRLSPKKTVEGFLGGAASTFVAALLATSLLTTLEAWDVKYIMLCPASRDFGLTLDRCDTDALVGGLFKGSPLASWPTLAPYVPAFAAQWHLSPMQLHALVLAAFASVVAPFGGFFASGFKRAFNVKDFGNTIPGHGGFTDRMDCQIVMGAFAAIYLQYVLRAGPGAEEDAVSAFTRAVDRMQMRGGELAALHGLLGCLLGRLPQLALGQGAALPATAISAAADACRAELPQLVAQASAAAALPPL